MDTEGCSGGVSAATRLIGSFFCRGCGGKKKSGCRSGMMARLREGGAVCGFRSAREASGSGSEVAWFGEGY